MAKRILANTGATKGILIQDGQMIIVPDDGNLPQCCCCSVQLPSCIEGLRVVYEMATQSGLSPGGAVDPGPTAGGWYQTDFTVWMRDECGPDGDSMDDWNVSPNLAPFAASIDLPTLPDKGSFRWGSDMHRNFFGLPYKPEAMWCCDREKDFMCIDLEFCRNGVGKDGEFINYDFAGQMVPVGSPLQIQNAQSWVNVFLPVVRGLEINMMGNLEFVDGWDFRCCRMPIRWESEGSSDGVFWDLVTNPAIPTLVNQSGNPNALPAGTITTPRLRMCFGPPMCPLCCFQCLQAETVTEWENTEFDRFLVCDSTISGFIEVDNTPVPQFYPGHPALPLSDPGADPPIDRPGLICHDHAPDDPDCCERNVDGVTCVDWLSHPKANQISKCNHCGCWIPYIRDEFRKHGDCRCDECNGLFAGNWDGQWQRRSSGLSPIQGNFTVTWLNNNPVQSPGLSENILWFCTDDNHNVVDWMEFGGTGTGDFALSYHKCFKRVVPNDNGPDLVTYPVVTATLLLPFQDFAINEQLFPDMDFTDFCKEMSVGWKCELIDNPDFDPDNPETQSEDAWKLTVTYSCPLRGDAELEFIRDWNPAKALFTLVPSTNCYMGTYSNNAESGVAPMCIS